MLKKIYLDETRLLLEVVVEWLVGQVRLSETGARSLDHLLLVMPTRQAGRRLRLALAEALGGCIPPQIRQPYSLLLPQDEAQVASAAELLAVTGRVLQEAEVAHYPMLLPLSLAERGRSFSWGVGVARQLMEVWQILAEDGLLMGDAAARIEAGALEGEIPPEEETRWQSLAQLEERVIAELTARGLKHPSLVRREAVESPWLPEGVEQVVLPALIDAQPAFYRALEALRERQGVEVVVLVHAPEGEAELYDVWGRPLPERWQPEVAPAIEFPEERCILTANSTEQAAAAAEIVAEVGSEEELPALGLADEELFSQLQAALLRQRRELHNPAAMPLLGSSLGKIVMQVLQLLSRPDYSVAAAWLRSADTWRFLQQRLGFDESAHMRVLGSLDKVRQSHLPQSLAELHRFSGIEDEWRELHRSVGVLRELVEAGSEGLAGRLRHFLAELFKPRPLDEELPEDRELRAAAEALDEVLRLFESEKLRGVIGSEQEEAELLAVLLQQATYSLEPQDPETILTDGWLELPWSGAAELIICGMNEESVPEAVVGHAFLPDGLRRALGLSDNERRLARDATLLRGLLRSRQPGSVTLLLERMNDRGDVRKPSRLLFMCGENDRLLAARAARLYQDADRPAMGHRWALPEQWRLRLPWPVVAGEAVPAEWPTVELPKSVSVTALSLYLESPFRFFLRYLLKMEESGDRQREMDSLIFGEVMHQVLQQFGESHGGVAESSDAGEVEAYLGELLKRELEERFGRNPSLVLRMQGETLRQRLGYFAVEHAGLMAAGWRSVATEESFEKEYAGVKVRGKVDRVDYHPELGYRVIDYKTWERKRGDEALFFKKKKEVAEMERLGYPLFEIDGGKGKKQPVAWRDLQLVLYRDFWQTRMAAAGGGALPIECGYFVLGSSRDETAIEMWSLESCLQEADATIKRALAGIKGGVFWPPLEMRGEYGRLFPDEMERGIAPQWVAEQERRLAALGVAAGGEA